jgi:hypothetical protein
MAAVALPVMPAAGSTLPDMTESTFVTGGARQGLPSERQLAPRHEVGRPLVREAPRARSNGASLTCTWGEASSSTAVMPAGPRH